MASSLEGPPPADEEDVDDSAPSAAAEGLEAVPIDIDVSQYGPQLQAKLLRLRKLFSAPDSGVTLPDDIKVHESEPIHYRMRAQFSVHFSGDEMHYVMFRPAPSPAPAPEEEPAPSAAPLAMSSSSSSSGATTAQTGTAPAQPRRKYQTSRNKTRATKRRSVKVRVDAFPVGSRLINDLMPLVLEACRNSPVLRHKLFQVNFQTTLSGEAMVTLLHHRLLGDEWKEAAEKLRLELAEACLGGNVAAMQVVGRSRGQVVELGRAYVMESLLINGQSYSYRQMEGSFSQPNAGVCQQMVAWAQDVTRPATAPAFFSQAASSAAAAAVAEAAKAAAAAAFAASAAAEVSAQASGAAATTPAAAAAADSAGEPGSSSGHVAAASATIAHEPTSSASGRDAGGTASVSHTGAAAAAAMHGGGDGGDLLELYCGNGNFTVPLAANFRRVIATEVSTSSVEAARHNFESNNVGNVFVARMASEEFAETWRIQGTRRRLQGLSWDDVHFSTLLVDPPRAGLDDYTVKLASDFPCIVYISCNPETLCANLAALSATHELTSFAVFDQFPYSPHLECGAYLVRRPQPDPAGGVKPV